MGVVVLVSAFGAYIFSVKWPGDAGLRREPSSASTRTGLMVFTPSTMTQANPSDILAPLISELLF